MSKAKKIHSSEDARRLARKRLPWMVYDYIDGAAGTGDGEARARAEIKALRLRPRIMKDVMHRSLAVDVFDHKSAMPFGISPMGMCNLSTPGADFMLARLAAKLQCPLGVSTVASTSLERIIQEAQGHAWFQLYYSGDGSTAGGLIDRAAAAGYRTLVVTLDVPEVGRRPRELSRGFAMPFKMGVQQFIDCALHPRWSIESLIKGKPHMANFGGQFGEFTRKESRAGFTAEHLKRVRDQWQGNLVVKGVLDVEDATTLKSLGVDAIQVSSHGGRQLDSAPAPILQLGKIREALGADFPLFYDSGIRHGEDIVKAYAMGADFVLLGRVALYAMAAAGEAGLKQMISVLESEISISLAQIGMTQMPNLNDQVLLRQQSQTQ